MLEKYNQLVQESKELNKRMLRELEDCGFVAVIKECKAAGDYSRLKDLIDQMEDSVPKAYIKRKLEKELST
jgi:hypothetical protein